MIMIGPRFGGAVTDAGRFFKYAVDNKMSVDEFLAYMKKNHGRFLVSAIVSRACVIRTSGSRNWLVMLRA